MSRPTNNSNVILLREFWRQSQDAGRFICRPDIAIFGYHLLKQYGKIDNTDVTDSIEFEGLKAEFLEQRHKNGALGYNINHPYNLPTYKNYVRAKIYEEYCLEQIKKGRTIKMIFDSNKPD